MGNLYTERLDSVTLEDILAFLSLDLPEDKRPPEGQRIDYKVDLPDDLGKTVASMSNADGGLILIGVKADKAKQNIPVAADGAALGADARARLANHILSTVSPRPDIDIVARKTVGGNRYVAVIRVSPGPWPPYQYSKRELVVIPVRVVDENRPATVSQIEALLRVRAEFDKPPEQLSARLDLGGFCLATPNKLTDHYIFHKVLLLPRRLLKLRLDEKFEREFENSVEEGFRFRRRLTLTARRTLYHEIGLTTQNLQIRCRAWRDGSLGFLRNDNMGRTDPEPVGNLARDVIFFLRMAKAFSMQHRSWGPFVFQDELYCPSQQFSASFPAPGGFTGYDGVPGFYFDGPQPHESRLQLTEEVDWAEIESPEHFVTTVLLQQVREVAGGRVKFDKARESVGRLASDSALHFT